MRGTGAADLDMLTQGILGGQERFSNHPNAERSAGAGQ
jgi:hypothetical protein